MAGSRLAARLGFPFVDTGGMYRAITWLALHKGIAIDDHTALVDLAQHAHLEISPPPPGTSEFATIRIDGLDATPHLRTAGVERAVSPVSAVAEVRAVMVQLQRRAAVNSIVMAGRDIGTVVLPHAELKIYLEASADVRAQRRLAEMLAKGREITLKDVLADLHRRDEIDSTRATAPLRAADDAVVINTDALTIEQVVEQMLSLARERGALIT